MDRRPAPLLFSLAAMIALVAGCTARGEPAARTTPADTGTASVTASSRASDSAAASTPSDSASTASTPSTAGGASSAAAPSRQGDDGARSGAPTLPPPTTVKPAAATTGGDSAAGGGRVARDIRGDAVVRGLYLNRWAAQSTHRLHQLIAIADSTEINAFVIDVKDELGLNYASADPTVAANAGRGGRIANLRAMVDTLKAHGIIPIARIVVFKDSVAARVNADHVIRQPDGSPWRDKQGLTWVDPYDHAIWEYNIRVAEEMARAGFAEVQFDYIRFPEPYQSLPKQIFRDANGVEKPQALARFLAAACARVHALGTRCTADIFGLVTTVPGALEVGQQWEALSPVVDVVLPMVYPSHYPHGAFGVDRPNAEPYRIVQTAIARARERDGALGIVALEHVRPWLQAFTLGQPPYGPDQLREQKRAVYDAGYDGWVLWNPGSKYEPYVPALERTLVSRKTVGPRTADGGSAASAAHP
ncbi:MAG TPA: putative glycoside hydrolase [Gemmatimonadaceae bacterium]|nr:putative glycoside hydrolase [Gemmatimonadaceae bacterium]